MKINPYNSPPPQQQKPVPAAAPDLKVVTLKDHFRAVCSGGHGLRDQENVA